MSRTLANTFLKKRVCIILLHPAFLCNHWSSSLQTRGVARQWAFWAWAYCDIRHWCLCSTARQNLNDKANVKHSNLTHSLVFYFLNTFPYHAHSYSPPVRETLLQALPSSASVGELLFWKLSSSAFSCSDDFPFTLSNSGNWLGTAFFIGASLGSGVTSALTSTGGGGTPSSTTERNIYGPKHARIFF